MASTEDLLKTVEKIGHQLGYALMKSERKVATISFVQGKDVFVNLPTGFWKSLCYGCLPLVFDEVFSKSGLIALIISPLVALMEDQVEGFSSRGLKCVRIGSCTEEIKQRVIQGEYQLVFISPEALLATRRWRKMLLNPIYQNTIIVVVADKAHCVRNWLVYASINVKPHYLPPKLRPYLFDLMLCGQNYFKYG